MSAGELFVCREGHTAACSDAGSSLLSWKARDLKANIS